MASMRTQMFFAVSAVMALAISNIVRADSLSNAEEDILDSLNMYRENVSPSAAAMPELIYSDYYENIASTYIAQCNVTDYDPEMGLIFDDIDVLASSTSNSSYYEQALASWTSEYSSNQNCVTNGTCGFSYMQIIFDQAKQVGCAEHYCSDYTNNAGTLFPGAMLVACVFDHPYNNLTVYAQGPSCSGCTAAGLGKCEDGTLCSQSDSIGSGTHSSSGTNVAVVAGATVGVIGGLAFLIIGIYFIRRYAKKPDDYGRQVDFSHPNSTI